MATKKKPVGKGLPEFVVDPADFGNNADWLLYTPAKYVRAKQLAEDSIVEGDVAKAGDYVMVTRSGEIIVCEREGFEREYEVVKGPHKQEF